MEILRGVDFSDEFTVGVADGDFEQYFAGLALKIGRWLLWRSDRAAERRGEQAHKT